MHLAKRRFEGRSNSLMPDNVTLVAAVGAGFVDLQS
jgi:hypothetical protein